MKNLIIMGLFVGGIGWAFSHKASSSSSSSESSSVGSSSSAVSSLSSSSQSSNSSIHSAELVKMMAQSSSCTNISWPERGRAPQGYVPGVALVYAKNVCDLKNRKASAVAIAAPISSTNGDALAYYGLSPSSEIERLRTTFSLLIGLGLRESSGSYCEGRDMSATNTSSDTAEAGAWQTSYNAIPAVSVRRDLFDFYKSDKTNCNLDTFKEGVSCRASQLKNFGSGDGLIFQELNKSCPAFAAEHAAINLRVLRRHYGPINAKAAQVRAECTDMLKQIEAVVEANGC